MKVRFLIICVLAWSAFSAGHAGAQTIQDQVVTQLKQQGYDSIRVSRTLLGRTRIIADSDESRREIVVNPRTGEILRDFWKLKEGASKDERETRILSSGKKKRKGGGSGNSGKGSSGSGGNSGPGGGHNDDDDDDDDDDDSDNSGPGSDDDDDDEDNSGSGNSDDDDDDDDDDD